jgi:glycerophosphoryl diester phosphodiesterase
MVKALDLGVTTLEMDVVVTKDKQVILSHDPFFHHEITSKADGSQITSAEEENYNIYQLDYDEVKKFDVGLKKHPRFPRQQKLKAIKPLLLDVIDTSEKYAEERKRTLPYYNIEIKSTAATDHLYHPEPTEFVDLVLDVIGQKQIVGRVIIQSFDIRILQYLHTKRPEITTALLIEDYDKRGFENHIDELGYKPSIYSPHYSLVDRELVAACKKAGIRVVPWTVNTKAEIANLKAMGVDGIITDYPDMF